MTYNNCTTQVRKFKHINYEQRKILERLLAEGRNKVEIAKILGISRSTLYEEIKRGTVKQLNSDLTEYTKYYAETGQLVYTEHRKCCRKPYKLTEVTEFIKYAEYEMLNNKMAPDTICGRAKKTKQFKNVVCTKTLYNYIDLGFLKVKNIDLPLRVKIKKNRKRIRKNRRILGESIENRPQYINDRTEFGHWEIDTVMGKKQKEPVLLTLDERLTRKRIMVKIEEKTSAAVEEAIRKIYDKFGTMSSEIFKSITSDNGSEFSTLSNTLPLTSIYYAHPYSSYERGTNEKQNSLIRYFLPKGKSLENISESSVTLIEDWINNLPRKFANYSTPNELFNIELNKLNIIL